MSQRGGSVYLNNGRYWLKARLPGAEKISQTPLKPAGGKFATKDRAIAELLAKDIWQMAAARTNPAGEKWDGLLGQLAARYIAWARSYYLPPSRVADAIEHAVLPLARECGGMMAEDFTPLDLKRWRDKLIDRGTLCRTGINRSCQTIRRMFRWAASEMLAPAHVYAALAAVEGLRQGRTAAKEGRKVLPAPPQHVAAILGRLSDVVADMIRLQLLTGMRGGEMFAMRPCDIDRSGKVWIYRPAWHKTAHLGHARTILLGPRGQKIISRYFDNRPADDFLFKPAESAALNLARRRLARKTPLNQGNRAGTNKKGTARYNEKWDANAYRKAIRSACIAAEIPLWHPHQLRHTAATAIRKGFGLDAARAVLGHRSVCITSEYAELDQTKAAQVAEAIG